MPSAGRSAGRSCCCHGTERCQTGGAAGGALRPMPDPAADGTSRVASSPGAARGAQHHAGAHRGSKRPRTLQGLPGANSLHKESHVPKHECKAPQLNAPAAPSPALHAGKGTISTWQSSFTEKDTFSLPHYRFSSSSR